MSAILDVFKSWFGSLFGSWRVICITAGMSLLAGVYIGYYAHTLGDEAAKNKALGVEVTSAWKAENGIIQFNQDFNKERNHETDPCLRDALPTGDLGLLR